MLTWDKREAIAKKAFKIIKTSITDQKKANKNSQSSWAPVVNLDITFRYGYTGAKDEKYRLTLLPNTWNGKEKHIIEVDTRSDLVDVIQLLIVLLNEQTKVRGWSTLKIVEDYFGNSWWSNTRIKYPRKVTLCNLPCKEYSSLQNYINKYGILEYCGKLYDFKLGNFRIFNSCMGGKRGVLWDEYGDREYLDNRPKYCESILKELREHRSSKDLMICKEGDENYIDPIDKEYSEKHEIECEGEKRHYLLITIKTPKGKVKYENKIY